MPPDAMPLTAPLTPELHHAALEELDTAVHALRCTVTLPQLR